jgi:hypothetical protein
VAVHFPRLTLAAFVVTACAGLSACSNGNFAPPAGPTNGTIPNGDQLLSVEMACTSPMLVGERAFCTAVARFRSGRAPNINFEADATFSSNRPDIAALEAYGIVRGVAAGESTITVSYQGQRATANVQVKFEDALKIEAAAEQGQFRPGNTVTMWLQGVYSVASADSGQLRLEIHDQDGLVVVAPKTVSRGGDEFVMSVTFAVPQTSTELCRTGALEVGSTRIAQSRLWCVPVRR